MEPGKGRAVTFVQVKARECSVLVSIIRRATNINLTITAAGRLIVRERQTMAESEGVNLWATEAHALDYLRRADTIPHRSEGEAPGR